MLAYPVGMEEDFRINEEKEHVEIVQRFQYRYLAGDWDTEPLEVAPFPPPVMLAAAKISKVDVNYAVDLNFPTMYGDLKKLTGIIYGSEPGCLDRTAPELLSWYGPEKLGQQEVHTLLMMDILTHRSSKEETVSRINQAYDNNRLFHEWITATPKYRRRVPENWGRCSLLTMLAARDYPVWIENWIGVDIKAAEYDESRKTSVIVLGKGPGVLNLGLQTGIRPKSVRFENRTVPAVLGTRNISLIIPSAGKLEITF